MGYARRGHTEKWVEDRRCKIFIEIGRHKLLFDIDRRFVTDNTDLFVD